VHHHIREDTQALDGFATADARRCFTALLGAHGVGPSLALGILSVHGPGDLARVLAEDDVAALCLVPGVGKKTATRLLVELKSRLDIPLDTGVPAATGSAGGAPGTGSAAAARADVREALAGLGYGLEEIRDVLADLPDGDDPSALLKHALQRLAVSR
jgi:Holliday junction DNA helicase RuvA